MKTITECLFCSSTHHTFRFTASDRYYEIEGTYDVYECDNCGLLFLNPQPSPEQLATHYPRTYFAFEGERTDDTRLERLYKILYGQDSSTLKKALFLPYRPLLRTVVGGPGKRILDVGCGSGHFLAIEKKLFDVDAYGVEPYAYDAAFAAKNNLNIFNGSLEQASFPDNFFDAITLNHVLEHVADPRSTLRELRRILKRGGTLVIGVPQSRSLLYWLFGKRWWSLDVPRHLFVPSSRNLKSLAESMEFKVKGVRYTGASSTILGTLWYWYNDLSGHKRYYCQVKQGLSVQRAVLPFVYLLNWLRISDMIEIVLTTE